MHIFVSMSLYAAAVALSHHSSSATVGKDHHEPSPGLAMLTLLITLPVEIIFLGILDGLQWLNLPILFVAFVIVLFFVVLWVFSSPVFQPNSRKERLK